MNIVLKNVYNFFHPLKVRWIERVRQKEWFAALLYSLSRLAIGWPHQIWFEKRKKELNCVFMDPGHSGLYSMYCIELKLLWVDLQHLCWINCIWSNYVWFAGKLPQSIGRIVATPYSLHPLFLYKFCRVIKL